ncbi:MAG: ATP-binding cassette domain-containing protein [Ruminiclostridium sp.]|nr:ATP-binding cassette domain-containing protein [Ruminiclostridium sp.]
MSLQVTNISKQYGSFTALKGLSFSLDEPGVYALLGTNGAGKTTAIRIILGMLSKNSGEVLWKGKPLSPVSEKVGYLAEERGLYPKFKIMEQLHYFAELKGMKKPDIDKAIDYWFERLELNDYRTKTAEQLSKGNQQKIQLVAALIADPELLILDEPLSGLDPVNANLFKEVINEEIAKKKYIIMSCHQMPVIEEFCNDITIMHHGNAVLQGNLNEIKKGYGRVNLSVKADGDILPLAQQCGLTPVAVTPSNIDFKIQNEEQAKQLLNKIVAADIPLVRFDLREPSLHEIFVEHIEKAEMKEAEE